MEKARGAIGAFESSALMPVWRARLRDVASIVGCWGDVSAKRKIGGGGQLFVLEHMRSGHFQERTPDYGANRNPSNAQVHRGKNYSLRGLAIAFGTEAQIDRGSAQASLGFREWCLQSWLSDLLQFLEAEGLSETIRWVRQVKGVMKVQ